MAASNPNRNGAFGLAEDASLYRSMETFLATELHRYTALKNIPNVLQVTGNFTHLCS